MPKPTNKKMEGWLICRYLISIGGATAMVRKNTTNKRKKSKIFLCFDQPAMKPPIIIPYKHSQTKEPRTIMALKMLRVVKARKNSSKPASRNKAERLRPSLSQPGQKMLKIY